MTFKDQLQRDADIFLNTDEFAEVHTIELEGVAYTLPLIIDSDIIGAMNKPLDGIYQSNITLYFKENAVKRKPVRGQIFILDEKEYCVVDVNADLGMLCIKIEVPDA